MKHFILIPLVTVLVAVLGSMASTSGMPWYMESVIKPELTPPNWLFPIAWTLIYALTTLSALLVYKASNKTNRIVLMALFAGNAVLNVLWSYLFFGMQLISIAFVEMLFLELNILLIFLGAWKFSKTASLLLLPYLVWVGFASFLTYQILTLN